MNNFSVLVVEDDEIDIENIKRAFKKINLYNNVYYVNDGIEAKEFIENKKPSHLIILLDLNMPRMSGIEFLEWLRESNNSNCPVIVLTTSSEEIDKKQAYKNCISGYILKPVDHIQFIERVSVLGKYWSICELDD